MDEVKGPLSVIKILFLWLVNNLLHVKIIFWPRKHDFLFVFRHVINRIWHSLSFHKVLWKSEVRCNLAVEDNIHINHHRHINDCFYSISKICIIPPSPHTLNLQLTTLKSSQRKKGNMIITDRLIIELCAVSTFATMFSNVVCCIGVRKGLHVGQSKLTKS